MTTRNRVLAALRDARETGVNGEVLAGSLGVSRVAVSKHVSALRALGYAIDASPESGYHLVGSPDLALPTEVGPLVTEPMWVRVEGGMETGSTNDDARALAVSGAAEGTVVVAARQTAGRGRLGRSWDSPDGGAYVSVVLRPPVAPAQAGPLALVVALGIARGLERCGLSVGLKWPNDVWLGERKLAGVLLEMTAEGDRVEWIVAGLGMNVRRPDGASPDVAYVSDVGKRLGVARVAAAALDGLASTYRQWLDEGFGRLAEEFEAHSVLTGRSVEVRDAGGTVRSEGVVTGIDVDGRLLLRDTSGTSAVVAGEVTLRG